MKHLSPPTCGVSGPSLSWFASSGPSAASVSKSGWWAPSTTPPLLISSIRSEAAVVPMSSGTMSGSEVWGAEEEEGVEMGGGRTCVGGRDRV